MLHAIKRVLRIWVPASVILLIFFAVTGSSASFFLSIPVMFISVIYGFFGTDGKK